MQQDSLSQHALATYGACRHFFDEAVRQGVRHAVISPGSRSTPLTLSADTTAGLRSWIRIDERSAAFFALGLAKATGTPTILICTSGTAAANYLPAVVEAHFSGVPLLVLTADRPPELRDWGAGQTIEQRDLYGGHVRWFFEAPVASADMDLGGGTAQRWWGSLARRATSLSIGANPGPVHINWPFREPLEPPADWLTDLPSTATADRSDGNPNQVGFNPSTPADQNIAALLSLASEHAQGVVVAGPMHIANGASAQLGEAVARFCGATGWPLLAEPTSQLRRLQKSHPQLGVINHFDLLLATDWASAQPPTAVVRIGDSPVSKPLRLWLEKHQPEHLLINPASSWTDASFTATTTLADSPAALLDGVADQLQLASHSADRAEAWLGRWLQADATAGEVIDRIVGDTTSQALTEAVVVRSLGRCLPADHTLVASNSLPVRSVNTHLQARNQPLAVHANRGASGIDGVISTAAGFAAASQPTTVLVGDLALRHDLGGLAALCENPAQASGSLTVLVIDNGGGMIFSGLPIAAAISADQFQRLFATPTTPNSASIAAALADAFGFTHYQFGASASAGAESRNGSVSADLTELADLLANPTEGVRLITVSVDAEADSQQRKRIAAEVNKSLDESAAP